METSLVINLAALVFSLLALVTSTFIAIRQTKLMRDANLLPVMNDLFKEFRAIEFRPHMAYVERQLWQDCPPESTRFANLPEEAKLHARPVTGFYTVVGALVANGVVDELLVASLMGGSILRAWRSLEPYIRNERQYRNDPNWQLFFENLAFRMMNNPPDKIYSRLGLKGMPSNTEAASAPQGQSEQNEPKKRPSR